jgi:hypothetical protein
MHQHKSNTALTHALAGAAFFLCSHSIEKLVDPNMLSIGKSIAKRHKSSSGIFFPSKKSQNCYYNLLPSPSLCYSLTHTHRSIGYRNRNPQSVVDSSTRLMYLRIYDSRVSSHHPVPSPSLCYSLTHAHNTFPTPTFITITCTQVLWCLERLNRPTVSCCETTRTRLTICLPT